jgi:Fur family zinc uptake transcriptional regulator
MEVTEYAAFSIPFASRIVTERRGFEATAERLAVATELCRDRGLRLTPLRRKILELLLNSTRPLGAYELIEALEREEARPVGPPTVYRTLDFLVAHGFVSRIESGNAYVTCAHPERHHACLFFICEDCGESVELEDPRIEQRLEEDAARLGFRPTWRVVEIQGTCASCLANASS